MDELLCDELIEEVFHRLPPPSSSAVSLVSKRWCRLLRSSTTSISLHFPPPYTPTTIASLSAFLSDHPFLSSVSLAGDCADSGDPLLVAVASSCPNLRNLRCLTSPVSSSSLSTLPISCLHLSSIAITISRPLSFHWLPSFNSLKSLSLYFVSPSTEFDDSEVKEMRDDVFDLELNLESLSLCGILPGDSGLSYLWRNCKNLKKLQLKSCESLGDYSSFLNVLGGLEELELRTCRSIFNGVLLKLAENCVSLDSLLVYDGGSREGLLQFINQCKCSLRRLDLRLPLDLDNSHLIALTENLNFRGLVSLRLQSCCLVTGEGLKVLARAIGNVLEELALINCDVVERESGLLATLGQDLKRLRKLDLSYNDMLLDKELVSMLVSCNCLDELKLRGCARLSNAAVDSMVRSCKRLESVDITYCCGIGVEGVEALVLNSWRLKRVEVEQSKVSEVARTWTADKFIEVVY
ncbi:hypothetical protein Salat_1381100 [Sesamum alatum]|uniref:F-box domain-containing protein n=1 Tax=Sesamum alatum TaxID=300844 RepID=A0AAE2CL31_9LAMI|nr:hypothetical protein Salat_1381100 [Sesamum alatum]